ncbi:GNAT family N-acetyltransferase (plasmid) [Streptomyces zhihengii]|uniref:GNAT family N-acetyltransferase n=1 Tax=Streptomyces zhihengii TaxID=1818004 RepID=A0ABS2V4H4_9ACTN|nr:GNAT family N-acetyltransferase [Streptomyces zhihengii]MBM9624739.1 GNAT family N-acetyltransferase [Streptomyces zhihengii]
MAGAEAQLGNEGVALWLTDWKISHSDTWVPRRMMALVGGELAGRLDFLLHPDGRALTVWQLAVEPQFQRRGLASVMMDALHAAHPQAWINHGSRQPDGARWWDAYTDPAPERNIHNRPMSEWAAYFPALQVAAHRAANAYRNQELGLYGHRDAEHRYGQALEEDALQWAAAYREAAASGPDPAVQDLYGGIRIVLPTRIHRVVHDGQRSAAERADMLLHHIGHGNLPHDQPWSTSRHAAFEDLADEQIRTPPAQPGAASTHVTFQVRLSAGQEVPEHHARADWVRYLDSPGIEVDVHGMAWRDAAAPWLTHETDLSPPVGAAIAPEGPASARYAARYDVVGELLPGLSTRRQPVDVLATRELEIAALARRITAESGARLAASGPPEPVSEPRRAQQPPAQTSHRSTYAQQPPRLR